jgi:hypothetical protein
MGSVDFVRERKERDWERLSHCLCHCLFNARYLLHPNNDLLYQKVNLLVLISDACKGSDLIAMSADGFLDLLSGVDNFDCFFLTFTLSTTTYKVYDVSLCHTAVLTWRGHNIYVDTFLFSDVTYSRSWKRFIVLDTVTLGFFFRMLSMCLCWFSVLMGILWRCCNFLCLSFLINLNCHNWMTNGTDRVISEINRLYYTGGSRGNLCY